MMIGTTIKGVPWGGVPKQDSKSRVGLADPTSLGHPCNPKYGLQNIPACAS